MSEIKKLIEKLSDRLEYRNEIWHRIWLENQAKQQNQTLQCPDPECSAFVPLRPDTFDKDGNRICFLCKATFVAPEYLDD